MTTGKSPNRDNGIDSVDSKTPQPDTLIKVGQFKKPYGIKGWLWVFSYLDDREDLFVMTPWWIKTAAGYQALRISQWRQQGTGLVVQLAQIPDRTAAEGLHNVSIWAKKAQVALPEDNEYFWSDLQGLQVVNQQNQCLGKIDDLFETGAHDVMTVSPNQQSIDTQTRLIPWHKQTVITVDMAQMQVRVDWPADF